MTVDRALEVCVFRGQEEESLHRVSAVCINSLGETIASWGDPHKKIFPRSSVKLIQAIPFLASGALESFNLDDRHLALACSSHRGEEIHIQLVESWLKILGKSKSDLVCGPHFPGDLAAYHRMIEQHQTPQSLHNNCSGKHTGILSTCKFYNEPTTGYNKYEHPAQKRFRRLLTEFTEYDHESAVWGIDGCSLPNYQIPLYNLARGLAKFLPLSRSNVDSISLSENIVKDQSLANKSSHKKNLTQLILQAIQKYPHLLSGTDEFVTRVISATNGRVIVKSGAEGVFVGLILDKDIAFALKAEDGSTRASQFAAAHIIKNFACLTTQEVSNIKDLLDPIVSNWAGLAVGKIELKP